MTRVAHVVALFEGANPAPDPGRLELALDDRAHLDAVEQWSEDMTETTIREINPAPTEGQSRWRPVSIAAAITLLVGLLAVSFFLNNRSDVAVEIRSIESAIAAYNDGDVETWVAAWDPTAQGIQPLSWGYFFEIFMQANEQMTIVEPCAIVGEASTESGQPVIVECLISYRDDFHGPAGVNLETEVSRFTLNTDGLITRWEDGRECCLAEQAFTSAFNIWLRDTHTDVYESIQLYDMGSLPRFSSDPANMAIAIQYVEEFVAQSDVYPLSDG